MLKTVLQRIVLAFLGVTLALLPVECALRYFKIGYGNSPFNTDRKLHHVHPRNYQFVAYDPGGEYGGHHIFYDADGLRTSGSTVNEMAAAAAKSTRIAFMGDSFVEAISVSFEDSFVGRLKATGNPETALVNFGVSSYSPILYSIQWDEVVRRMAPTHVVLMVFSNDFRDDREYAKSATTGSSGAFVAVPGPSSNWLSELLRSFFVFRLVRRFERQINWNLNQSSDESFRSTGGYIEENPRLEALTTDQLLILSQKIRATGAHFILTAVPSKYQVAHLDEPIGNDSLDSRLAAWAASNGIEYVSLTPAFLKNARSGRNLFFERDIHFSREGHRVIAEAIRVHLSEFFLKEEVAPSNSTHP